MRVGSEYLKWLRDINIDDQFIYGKNASELGELLAKDVPIPDGVVITQEAYSEFKKQNRLDLKIKHLLNTVNFEKPESVAQIALHIQNLIISTPIPEAIQQDLLKFYTRMSGVFHNPQLVIRISPLHEAVLTGYQDIAAMGEASLIECIKQAWSFMYSSHMLSYFHAQKKDPFDTYFVLIVQEVPSAEVSGVVFTQDPVTHDKNRVVIEAVFGLSESMLSGRLQPDHYIITKSGNILEKQVSKQEYSLIHSEGDQKKVLIPPSKQKKPKLTDTEITQLTSLSVKLEKAAYFPQDAEWVLAKNKFYFTSLRPLNTDKVNEIENISIQFSKKALAIGVSLHQGIASGPVKLVHLPGESDKVQMGDVMVIERMSPAYLHAIKRSSGVIIEEGGLVSQGIRGNQFSQPVISHVDNVLSRFQEGMVVTLNGQTGEIFRGNRLSTERDLKEFNLVLEPKSKTKLFLELDSSYSLPQSLEGKYAGAIFSPDHLIKEINIHPRRMLHEGESDVLSHKIETVLRTIARAVDPHPVYYQFSNLTSVEYLRLTGGKSFESIEDNPLIGFRGINRLIQQTKILEIELEVLRQLVIKEKVGNIQIILPFVRAQNDIIKFLNYLRGKRLEHLPLWLSLIAPSSTYMISDLLTSGIHGVMIQSSIFESLLFGMNVLDPELASSLYAREEVVIRALAPIVFAMHKANLPFGMTDIPSPTLRLVEYLVSENAYAVVSHGRDFLSMSKLVSTVEKTA